MTAATSSAVASASMPNSDASPVTTGAHTLVSP